MGLFSAAALVSDLVQLARFASPVIDKLAPTGADSVGVSEASMTVTKPTRLPGVMVSSTFYDLKQVREDLRRFLEDIGCQPFVAEHSSFPVTPDVDAKENCRLRVERDADILVLILCTRYGSIDERTATSVTNMEYLAAHQKSIPIYACFDRQLAAMIPVWKANPQADFSRQVDDARIFAFADRVQQTDGVWRFEFDYAQDIVGHLRRQFGFLFSDALDARRLLHSRGDHPWVQDIQAMALRLALEQPDGWELLLFGQVLTDALQEHVRLRRQQQFQVTLTRGEEIPKPTRWLKGRFRDCLRMGRSMDGLMAWLTRAVGGNGAASDAGEIVLAAQSLSDLYRALIEWSLRVRSANMSPQFNRAKMLASKMVDAFINDIEEFGPRVLRSAQAELAKPEHERQPLNFTFVGRVHDEISRAFNEELRRLSESYDANGEDRSEV